MKRILGMMCVAALAVSLVAGGCGRRKAGSESVQIKGSDTMVNLVQAWAEEYMKRHKGASLAVTGGGSGTGIAALINGTTSIAESSRAIKPEEIEDAKSKGIEPKEYKVGFDGIAVVAHPDNPVASLTVAQLADIFTGRTTNWKDLGGNDEEIVVLSREVNSGTHVYFKEHVLNGGDSKGTEEFAPSALLMPSSQAIADEVAQNKSAIGYYGMGYISEKQKVILVAKDSSSEATEPTLENVLSGEYPISRPLFMYTNGEPTGATKDFIDFVLSDDGQKIVKELDFVPLR